MPLLVHDLKIKCNSTTTHLVHVQFNIYKGHPLLHIFVMFQNTIKWLRTNSMTKLRKSSSLLVVEKKQCFREMTLQWSVDRIICNSLFLYLLSCRTFLMETVSPVSMHLAWIYAYSQSEENEENIYIFHVEGGHDLEAISDLEDNPKRSSSNN